MTNSSKVEPIELQSFASSAIFTWPLTNWLPLLQASWQVFAGKMLPQPGGGKKCFPRVHQIPKNSFFNLFKLEANYFTILWWVLPHIDMNQPWVYMCPPVPNPPPTSLPIPSLWVVPVHQLWVPFFMHWIGLVIYFTYGNIYVSMLFSQIIPPLPTPTVSQSVPNEQIFTLQELANLFLTGKSVLTIMVPILINKHVFEPWFKIHSPKVQLLLHQSNISRK